ncbi:MAG: hypothetical protein WC516_05800 [Patescibacteria group bacterium]|jgi:hypothetical protein
MFGMFWGLCKENGATIVELVLLILLCVALGFIYQLLKKIATNHLHTIQESIDKILGKVENLEATYNQIDKRVTILEVKEDQ